MGGADSVPNVTFIRSVRWGGGGQMMKVEGQHVDRGSSVSTKRGGVWGGGVLSPMGEGAVPPSQKIF